MNTSNKNPTGKCLTYEEIGSIMNISPQQVHKIEKEAFNKFLRSWKVKLNMDIFDSIIFVSSFLGIEHKQCFKKLDKENKEDLKQYLLEHKGMYFDGV